MMRARAAHLARPSWAFTLLVPAKDLYHDQVRAALVADGWTITHDPLRLSWGKRDLFVDLGADRILAAEKENQKIAVEVKSFIGASEVDDLEKAVGKYVVYRAVLAERDPTRVLHLAVPARALDEVILSPLGDLVRQNSGIRVIGFDPESERIVVWLP